VLIYPIHNRVVVLCKPACQEISLSRTAAPVQWVAVKMIGENAFALSLSCRDLTDDFPHILGAVLTVDETASLLPGINERIRNVGQIRVTGLRISSIHAY
jgi:hypothetical protein